MFCIRFTSIASPHVSYVLCASESCRQAQLKQRWSAPAVSVKRRRMKGCRWGAASLGQQLRTDEKGALERTISTNISRQLQSLYVLCSHCLLQIEATAQKLLRSLEWSYSFMSAFCRVMQDQILKELAARLTSYNIPFCCYHIHCFTLAAKLAFYNK